MIGIRDDFIAFVQQRILYQIICVYPRPSALICGFPIQDFCQAIAFTQEVRSSISVFNQLRKREERKETRKTRTQHSRVPTLLL